MKKLWIIACIVVMVFMVSESVKAGEYLTYQHVQFDRAGGKLLRDFSRSDYRHYYERLASRRFWGWRTTTAHYEEPVSFQKETLYVIVNEGRSPIIKAYNFTLTEQVKRQLSVSGNIGLRASGEVRRFNLNLDSHISPSYTHETTTTEVEDVEIRMQIDPMSELRVEVYGTGRVTNGVAKYYRFFRNVRSGGWEVFTVSTEYLSVVQRRIEGEEDEKDDA